MADVRNEAPAHRFHVIELARHVIEARGKPGQFVSPGDDHAFLILTGGDALKRTTEKDQA
jgi:hypothetical protein